MKCELPAPIIRTECAMLAQPREQNLWRDDLGLNVAAHVGQVAVGSDSAFAATWHAREQNFLPLKASAPHLTQAWDLMLVAKQGLPQKIAWLAVRIFLAYSYPRIGTGVPH